MGIIFTVDENLYQNGCNFEFDPFIGVLILTFMIFLIGIPIIFCISKQSKRRISYNNEHIPTRELNLYSPLNQHPVDIPIRVPFPTIMIPYNEILFYAVRSCIISIDLYVIPPVEIVEFNNEMLPLIDRQESIYYIDGSYSHRMQIGHSGFRASDGSSVVQCYSPQYPRRGSTESEVFAAYLAIQHARENGCDTLIICTDNSKVEQLLCRPKVKDNRDYPDFCQILNQYRQKNGARTIRVERVRGHTTRNEQNQSEKKRQFAKIDRLVRKKNRRYIRRQRIRYARYYWYRYNISTYYRWEASQYFFYF